MYKLFSIMTKENNNVVEASQLALLEKKIFWVAPIQECIDDHIEMYTNFMCSDAAEDTTVRNHITVTHKTVMKLLGCIQMAIDPDGEVSIEMTFE